MFSNFCPSLALLLVEPFVKEEKEGEEGKKKKGKEKGGKRKGFPRPARAFIEKKAFAPCRVEKKRKKEERNNKRLFCRGVPRMASGGEGEKKTKAGLSIDKGR